MDDRDERGALSEARLEEIMQRATQLRSEIADELAFVANRAMMQTLDYLMSFGNEIGHLRAQLAAARDAVEARDDALDLIQMLLNNGFVTDRQQSRRLEVALAQARTLLASVESVDEKDEKR